MRKKLLWAVVALVIVFVISFPAVSYFVGDKLSEETISKVVGIPVFVMFMLWGIGSVIASYSKREGKNL